MRQIFITFMLTTLFFSVSVRADERGGSDKNFNGQLTFNILGTERQIKDLPKFDDFPAERITSRKIAPDIDWSSNKKAWGFRTRLREGLKKGANFNGHYTVITHGCGVSCQVNWIVDVNNGKILGEIATSLGASYNLNSSLIVGNLASQDTLQEHFDAGSTYIKHIDFYKIERNLMTKIRRLDVYEEIEKLKKK